MSRIVYRFPPVRIPAAEWTVEQPVNRSRRMWDQAVVTSGSYRKRRVVAMRTISIADYGGGYVEALKELLEGGENLVRLYSLPVNHRGNNRRTDRQSWPVGWRAVGGNPLAWENASGAITWFTGPMGGSGPIRGEILGGSQGFGAVRASGLPSNTLVIEPGEFVAFHPTFDSFEEGQFQRRRALRPATTDGAGSCIVWTVTPFTGSTGALGFVNLGVRDTGVFMVDSMPRAMRTPYADWPYDWMCTEVFEDETPGGFIERNPWGASAQGD